MLLHLRSRWVRRAMTQVGSAPPCRYGCIAIAPAMPQRRLPFGSLTGLQEMAGVQRLVGQIGVGTGRIHA